MIKNLWSLHKAVAKGFVTAILKEKNFWKALRNLWNIIKSYIKELIGIYKDSLAYVTDKKYRQKIKYIQKYNEVKKIFVMAIKLLRYIDIRMEERGLDRVARRQFWHDFMRNGKIREDIFTELMNTPGMIDMVLNDILKRQQ